MQKSNVPNLIVYKPGETYESRHGKKPKDTEKSFELLPDDAYRKRKRKNVTLSARAIAIAKRIDHGNVSRGIERALFYWSDMHGKKDRKTP